MVNTAELRGLIDQKSEWLLVRESGRAFPLGRGEIEVAEDESRRSFAFTDDKGFHLWRLERFAFDGREIAVDVAGSFGRKKELIRLVPRITAAEMAADVELARLEIANKVGSILAASFVDAKIERIALNEENGRLALITFTREGVRTAALFDVTATMTHESILTSAMIMHRQLSMRSKRAVSEILLIGEKRAAKRLQKLHALLFGPWRSIITVAELSRRKDSEVIRPLRKCKITELWGGKAPKLELPKETASGDLTQKITSLAPDKLDIVHSKHGKTFRYLGLPVARVRQLVAGEKAWYGVGPRMRRVDIEDLGPFERLLDDVTHYRSDDPPNKKHEFYHRATEAWLESLLRRNIAQLDANLILSPIYDQFRSSSGKIDLLALRKDGRLVIIEVKTSPDREMVFQAADYWRKIEFQRRKGVLAEADLFEGRRIADRPALVYLVAPALSFHYEHEYFSRAVSPEIELWRFDLHQNWRKAIKALSRRNYADDLAGSINR